MRSRRRRSSGRRAAGATSLGASVVLLICFGMFYLLRQAADSDTGLPGAPRPARGDETTSGGWYQLYFTEPAYPDPGAHASGVDEVVAASIGQAQQSVDVAAYDIDLYSLVTAFVGAQERGVRVRVVTDTDNAEEAALQAIVDAGVPVVYDDRSAIMHDKFIVLDGAAVWTGSWNLTINDTYRNDNNLMRLNSPTLAANYAAEFEEMFSRGEFGASSTANTPEPWVKVEGRLVENYFAPEDHALTPIVALVNSAQESIYFMAFTFTHADIAQAIIGRAQAGVAVQGVFETRQVNAGSNEVYDAMRAAGLDVRLDGNPYTMHHKVIVVDGRTVVFGSYNFTDSAENSNDENVLIVHDADIAAQFTQEFQRVWAASRT